MDTQEINQYLTDFENEIGMEELLLKHPIDMMMAFNQENVKIKIQDNMLNLSKYEQEYIRAEAKYIELKDLLERIGAEQFEWYKFEHERSLEYDEIIKFYLPKDPKIVKIKKVLAKQRFVMNFYKLCVQCFQKQGERMHDFIKILNID